MISTVEIVIIVLLFGGAVGAYFRDLAESTSLLARKDQDEATEGVDRLYALADLMLIAMIADGELSDAELDMLRDNLVTSQLDVTFDELVARIRFKEKQLRTTAQLKSALRVQADRLDEADRELAFTMIVSLSQSGSRLRPIFGYRDSVSKGAPLLQLFAEALSISDERRAVLGRWTR